MSEFHSTKWWQGWCKRLWKKNEKRWSARTGQDHLYRELVVLPALLERIVTLPKPFHRLVDLGCGDGIMTKMLVDALGREELPVTCFDRSPLCDDVTDAFSEEGRLGEAIHGDLDHMLWNGKRDNTREEWLGEFASVSTLWISIFALQEMPRLEGFFRDLGRLMLPGDHFLAVVVDPTFAERLMRRGYAPFEGVGSLKDDFRYAMRYPIASGDGPPFFLPNFQRTIHDYKQLATHGGLGCHRCERLTVRKTPKTKAAFERTVYGADILNHPSALLFDFESTDERSELS